MKAEALKRRIGKLEAAFPEREEDDIWKRILPQCTDDELSRLGEILQRFEGGNVEPTEEEERFFAELEAKYAHEE